MITNLHNTNHFSFTLKTEMEFGVGIAKNINQLLADYGYKRFGLVIDSGVSKNDVVKELISNLGKQYVVEKIFENKVSEPYYDYLDECKKEFSKSNIDCLIGIGGGSTLDLTKGIAALLTNSGKGIKYRGFGKVINPSKPIIAIPTTAGTGSEVTPFAVFTDKKENVKLGINTEYNRPKLAILDPLLTLTCPKSVVISSGMDALVHAIESYASKGATHISQTFSKEAFSLLFPGLKEVVDEMKNVEIRSKLLLGSYIAGIALTNSGGGPTGALSYPLGVHFDVSHGLAGAVYLNRIVKFNIENGCNIYGPLYNILDNTDRNLDKPEKNKRFSITISNLSEKLDIPKKLTAFGVTKENVKILINEYERLKGAFDQNPVPFTRRDMKRLLYSMI